jgi:heme oxygenase (biliverdin-IX-beta and delta-forming)
MTGQSAREVLKSATEQHHKEIEEVIQFSAITNLDRYKMLVQRFLAFYAPVEDQVRLGRLDCALDWERRKKTPALLVDHQALGLERAPQFGGFRRLESIPQLLGYLYVAEGSTLGGQFLFKQFSRAFNLDENTGARFFYGYGPDTGKKWQSFLTVLEAELQTAEHRQAAAESAEETFVKMAEFFKRS